MVYIFIILKNAAKSALAQWELWARSRKCLVFAHQTFVNNNSKQVMADVQQEESEDRPLIELFVKVRLQKL